MNTLRRSRAREMTLVVVFFSCIALVWWWPVVREFSTMVAGLGGDPFQTLWRIVRFGDVVRQGSFVIPEEQMFRNFGPLPWMPFAYFFGETAVYNGAWLASGVLAGVATYVLARLLGAPRSLALLAGILVEFSPYRLAQALGHFGAMQVWWIPATLIAARQWIVTRRWRWAFLCVVGVVGTAWTEHQLFLSLLILLGILSIWHLPACVRHVRASTLQVSVVALLIAAGALWPFRNELRSTASPQSFLNPGESARARFAATPASIFLPPPFHLLRSGNSGYGGNDSTVADHVQTLGLALPVVVLFLSRRARFSRTMSALLTAACVGVILALGPRLSFGDMTLPLPGALFGRLPVLSSLRTVGRFIALAVIALPVLTAVLVGQRVRSRFVRYTIAGLLVAEILPGFGYPRMLVPRALVDVFTSISPGAILVLPGYTNDRVAGEHLYLSAFHHHALVGNSAFERVTDPVVARGLLRTPVVGDLLRLDHRGLQERTFFGQDPVEIAPAIFAFENIRAVVVDERLSGSAVALVGNERRTLTPEERAAIRAFLRADLGLREERVTDQLFFYHVPPSSGAPFAAIRGDGWTLVERTPDLLAAAIARTATFELFVARAATDPLSFTARVRSKEPRTLTMRAAAKNAVVRAEPGSTITIPLGAVPRGTTFFSLDVDMPGLVLENPRIVTSSRQ